MFAAVKETLPGAGPELSGTATAVLPAGSPVRAPEFPATTGDPPGVSEGEDLERLVYLGRMVSAVSHELGNRLTSVLGFAEMAAQAPDTESAPRLLAKMNNYAESLRNLVESLTGFSSQRLAAAEECDPGIIVRQVVELVSCHAKAHGVRVLYHRKGELPRVQVVIGEARLGLFMCLDVLVQELVATGLRDAHVMSEVRKSPDGGVQVVFRASDLSVGGVSKDSVSTVLARARRILAAQGVHIKWAEREKGVNEVVAEFSCKVCPEGP